jgi:hypothetical protein
MKFYQITYLSADKRRHPPITLFYCNGRVPDMEAADYCNFYLDVVINDELQTTLQEPAGCDIAMTCAFEGARRFHADNIRSA